VVDRFEAQGEWWLPDRPERRVSGTLSFDPDSGSTLSLIGSLREWHERGTPLPDGRGVTFGADDFNRSGTYPRILGEAGNTAYTLEDAFQSQLSNVLGEALEATGVSFRLRHLAYWVCESGLSERVRFPNEDGTWAEGPWATLNASHVPDRQGLTPHGLRLILGQSLGTSGDGIIERSLTQDFYFRLEGDEKQPLNTLIELASDLQDLVSVAVDRTASFESMSFFHPDIQHRIAEDHSIPLPIEYFVRWADRDTRVEKAAVHVHEMAFTLPDLGGIHGVEKWLAVAAVHRTALGRVMASRYRGSMYISDQMLNRAAALEAFDRTASGFEGSKFTTRMMRCAEIAGSPFTHLVGDVAKWAEVLRSERNESAHHLDRRVLGSAEQLHLSDTAYWLFVLCMLREANAPSGVFDRIEANNGFDWLAKRIRAVL
jgi:hypothetical protein